MGICPRSWPRSSTATSPRLRHTDPAKGLDAAKALAKELEADHPDAAASCSKDWRTCSPSVASASRHAGQDADQHQCIESMISIASAPPAGSPSGRTDR